VCVVVDHVRDVLEPHVSLSWCLCVVKIAFESVRSVQPFLPYAVVSLSCYGAIDFVL